MIKYRKIFNFGLFRTSLSKSGLGFSWGIPGLRFGVTPNGRKYFSIGIPGTGLYIIKYFDVNPNASYQKTTNANQKKSQPQKMEQWWKQKNLMD
jgi:hypothetical protein